MTPLEPPEGAKLDMPILEPPNPDPKALPNPGPPRLPNPEAAFAANGDAPAKPVDEAKPLLGLGPKEPNPEPEPGPEELLRLPKGDLDELAKAESPDDANADEDVCGSSFPVGSASGPGDFAAVGRDLGEARVPKGETVEVSANPEDFST